MKSQSPLHWEAYEYEPRDKSSDWFWAVGILTVAIAITSIIFNNILFAIVILIGGFSLTIYTARKPDIIEVTIDDRGIQLDKYFYPYRTMESFWVENEEGSPKILLKSQKLIMPYVVIPIEEFQPETVREYLREHLPEVFHSESQIHKLIEYLGF